MDGFNHSTGFDQTFGTKSTIHSIDSNTFSKVSTTSNFSDGQDLVSEGRIIASTRQSVLHYNGHDTYVNGSQVSSTSPGLTGETDIYNSHGQEIGEIRPGFDSSDRELYVNQHHVATANTDVSGNQRIMMLEDPLTRAHEFALMELILSN
jgi:hypothetical protein